MPARDEQIREESLWFGSPDQPLFGRLATPMGESAKGAVLISPPIGRESRLARHALRSLAIYLARDGYVSLRYDHFGTGDSSGSLDGEFDSAWVEGVDRGIEFLRSLGIASLSAVGMRMGATIVGAAASARDLGLTSFVMWDPCESGRTYVREVEVLGAMRQHVLPEDLRDSTKLLEYPLNDESASRISRLSLTGTAARDLADRVLVVARDDRTLSRDFRAQYQSEGFEWTTTSEQGALLETELPSSVRPTMTIARIRAWLTAPESPSSLFSNPISGHDAVVIEGNALPVRESAVELGTLGMFGIVSEPTHDARGPLVVMVNGINEDHVGPSRLWVELSRRWAGAGLRCLRFDPNELGESAWSPDAPDRSVFDRSLRFDVSDAVRALNPLDPSDSVLIGLCSGAQLALESGLDIGFRELCAINPQVGTVEVPTNEGNGVPVGELARLVGKYVDRLAQRHQVLGKGIKLLSRLAYFSAFSPQVKSDLARNHSSMLLLLGPNDPSPFSVVPIFGSLLGRRLISSEHIEVKIIPALDHDFLSTLGRDRAVAILDRHVVDTYANHPESSSAHRPVEDVSQ
jgi:dienelactone hydrolase